MNRMRQSNRARNIPPDCFVLAPVAWVTGESALAMRLAMAALGAITVGMLGILGREIANDTTGFVAAVIAALYPFLWVNDGLLMSETLCALTITLCIYFAYRFSNRPTLGRAAILGVLCGIAALARTELILLVPLFGIWFLVARHRVMRAVRWRAFGALVAGAALMTMPWVAYNLARFDEPTFLSTNDGVALLGSNCAAVYSGSAIGGTDLTPGVCLPRVPPRGDDSVEARVYREKALSYIGRHEVRFPVVLTARVGRTWGLFRPQDELPAGEGEGESAVDYDAWADLVLPAHLARAWWGCGITSPRRCTLAANDGPRDRGCQRRGELRQDAVPRSCRTCSCIARGGRSRGALRSRGAGPAFSRLFQLVSKDPARESAWAPPPAH
jgi:Dolichyl-phosphate-mannose-protein mannosyltransferase